MINLRELREKAGLSQVALANLANISVQTIKDVENNRRGLGLKALEGISKALGIPIDELIGEGEVNPSEQPLRTIEDFKRAIINIPGDILAKSSKYSETDQVWEMVRAAFSARELIESEKSLKTQKA